MTRSYSAFSWLCMTVGALLTIGFILALHIPQSYRNARRKAAQARTAPMVRPNLPDFPEQPRRGVR